MSKSKNLDKNPKIWIFLLIKAGKVVTAVIVNLA
jgi:hypothetical protein